jgi:hypothetical protein
MERNQQRPCYPLVWTALPASMRSSYSDQLSLSQTLSRSLCCKRQLVVHHTMKLSKLKPICCLDSLMEMLRSILHDIVNCLSLQQRTMMPRMVQQRAHIRTEEWTHICFWQKLHSHAYTHAMVCSFVSFTYYLIYLRRWIAKKIRLWRCLFASFVSLSQLIIVIWIKTSVGITTAFHTGISRAVAAA